MNKREYYLLRKYGITEAQYEDLFQRQGGCCAICKRPAGSFKTRLAVDHDHRSGHIRGLLCFLCNKRVIGRYRREQASIFQAAYTYLTAEYPGWIAPPKSKKRKCKRKKRKNGKKLLKA